MQFTHKSLLVGVGVLGGATLLLWWHSADEVPTVPLQVEQPSYEVATTSPVTIPVSGVVEATDSALIAATANGVVSEVTVVEGSAVDQGSLLVQQQLPVAASERTLRAAETELTRVQQAAAVDAQRYTAQQAAAIAYSAETIAALTATANQARTKEELAHLRASVEAGVTSLLRALTFAQDNRHLFTDEEREQFTTIAATLYGRLPNQFHTGVLYGTPESGDVLAQLAALRQLNMAELSLFDVQRLAVVVAGQLRAAVALYTTAEDTVLDPGEVSTGGPVYNGYFSARADIIAQEQAIATALAALARTIDSIETQTATQAQSVVVSDLDQAMAARQATFADDIGAAASAVAQAAEGVTQATQSLGVVTAPFAGSVAEVLIEPGEFAAAGAPLLRLVGEGARELTIRIPASVAPYVADGAVLTVDGRTVGQVVHRSPVSVGNSRTLTVTLTDPSLQTGAAVRGDLALTPGEGLFSIPRAYVELTSAAPAVTDQAGQRYPVEVVSDNGAQVVVRFTTAVPTTPLTPVRTSVVGKY